MQTYILLGIYILHLYTSARTLKVLSQECCSVHKGLPRDSPTHSQELRLFSQNLRSRDPEGSTLPPHITSWPSMPDTKRSSKSPQGEQPSEGSLQEQNVTSYRPQNGNGTNSYSRQLGQCQTLRISGGRDLSGEICVSGAKNSALVLMTAAVLTTERLQLHNMPNITDVNAMGEILQSLGISLLKEGDRISLHGASLTQYSLSYVLAKSLRASFFCIGPLLSRLGIARVPLPGGCKIGKRPVEEHIKGLQAMGAQITIEHGVVLAVVPGSTYRLKGAQIHLGYPSVGATETLMMAAVLADGKTILDNAAQEPEVVDLANLLIAMGARVRGAGTPTINIVGVERLHGANYSVIPDRIEAGTFLIAAAITRSRLKVNPLIPDHLGIVIKKLKEMGCSISSEGTGLVIDASQRPLRHVNIRTQPFPGFPTDLQPPFMALLATVEGHSMVTETIFENRLQYVEELNQMGALIQVQNNIVTLKGSAKLSGALITGSDLRATAAMVLAGLAAEGDTRVMGLHHLDRGYVCIEEKLRGIGAHIQREELPCRYPLGHG